MFKVLWDITVNALCIILYFKFRKCFVCDTVACPKPYLDYFVRPAGTSDFAIPTFGSIA